MLWQIGFLFVCRRPKIYLLILIVLPRGDLRSVRSLNILFSGDLLSVSPCFNSTTAKPSRGLNVSPVSVLYSRLVSKVIRSPFAILAMVYRE